MHDPLDELAFLTRALSAHLLWTKQTGSHGLPPCTEDWLAKRREHYRLTALEPADTSPVTAALPTPVPAPVPPAPVPPAPVPPAPEFPPAAQVEPGAMHGEERVPTSQVEPGPSSHPMVPQQRVAPAASLDTTPSRHVLPGQHVPSPAATPTAVELFAPGTPEDRPTRLRLLQERVSVCTACGLADTRTQTVFARGDGSAEVVFLGEGPGADEDAQGLPFVGAAGQLLDRMIAAMGLERDSVYVCNVIKCRPPKNRKPSDEEMAACRPYLSAQLELLRPKVIVALGGTAVEGLLGLKMGITRLRGTWRLYNGRIPVMPTFHPAYLLRQPDAKRLVWDDLQAVLARLNLPIPSRRA